MYICRTPKSDGDAKVRLSRQTPMVCAKPGWLDTLRTLTFEGHAQVRWLVSYETRDTKVQWSDTPKSDGGEEQLTS